MVEVQQLADWPVGKQCGDCSNSPEEFGGMSKSQSAQC